nr:MAG TPA: hypothetical protein [Caudoviricetes sp.]
MSFTAGFAGNFDAICVLIRCEIFSGADMLFFSPENIDPKRDIFLDNSIKTLDIAPYRGYNEVTK